MNKERVRKTCYYCGSILTDGGMEIKGWALPWRGGYKPMCCAKCYEEKVQPEIERMQKFLESTRNTK